MRYLWYEICFFFQHVMTNDYATVSSHVLLISVGGMNEQTNIQIFISKYISSSSWSLVYSMDFVLRPVPMLLVYSYCSPISIDTKKMPSKFL